MLNEALLVYPENSGLEINDGSSEYVQSPCWVIFFDSSTLFAFRQYLETESLNLFFN